MRQWIFFGFKNISRKSQRKIIHKFYVHTCFPQVLLFVKLLKSNLCVHCRPKWPHGVRREITSLARTLGSWVRITLEAWMSICVYSAFVLGSGLATGWSAVQRVLPTVLDNKLKWNEAFHGCRMLQSGSNRNKRRDEYISFTVYMHSAFHNGLLNKRKDYRTVYNVYPNTCEGYWNILCSITIYRNTCIFIYNIIYRAAEVFYSRLKYMHLMKTNINTSRKYRN
jgi:hypothetical protein